MNEDDDLDTSGSEWGSDAVGDGEPSFPDEPLEQSESISEPLEGEENNEEASGEEKPPATATKEPKKRVSGKTRINQLYREKSRAENEAQLLRQEVEKLRKQNETSTQAAMAHYDSTIKLKLDRAKQLKAHAIETGDVNAQIEADVELSRVAAQMEQLEAYSAQQRARERDQQVYAQQYTQEPAEQYNQPELNDDTESWLSQNTWFVPNSPDFDQDMHEEVRAYADALDRKLRRSGQENKIMTQEYFDQINEYVQREFYEQEPMQARNNQGNNLNMKPATRAQVAPVGRNTGAAPGAPASNRKVTLTAEEKDFIRYAKISPEDYIKSKMSTERIAKTRGEQRRG